jgi:formylglycine-generating enzyme required for sulfatase activity
MQETPVTQKQYEIITGQNPATFNDEPENPVEQVSWDESVDFTEKLSRLVRLKFGLTARLPTEMEWEYAARGGDGDKYTYAGSNYINEVAWYHDNSNDQPHPVKQKKPNGYGLYDMTGNVNEWCSDVYGKYPNQELIDYQGSTTGQERVFRGGSWNVSAVYARVAFRYWRNPIYRNLTLGLRLVLETL